MGATDTLGTVESGRRPMRAICVCNDAAVGAVVQRALASTGLVVEHASVVPVAAADVAVIVVDRAARKAAGEALRAARVPVIVVGDDLDDDGLIALMHEAPVSHLVADPTDRELGITSEKLVSGDVFGLEKYLAPAVAIGERIVRDEPGKARARAEVCAWAESVGARRATVHRLASVVDELLMNALGGSAAPGGAVLRWAADDRALAISVSDGHGALSQRDVIAHVRRARDERGRPNPASEGGAGLGLYLVLANVASLVVNVAPGIQTEVVCLFALARGIRPSVSRVRSLHVFATGETRPL